MRAFSLIELLVVISIVGILSAIAVPAYKHYVIRSQLTSVITVMKGMADEAQKTYALTGSFPTRLQYNNTPYGSGSPAWVMFNIPIGSSAIVALNYNRSPDGRGFLIQATTTATSKIPGYVAPGVGGAYDIGSYSMLTYGIRDLNGVMVPFCGNFLGATSTESIPTAYLPTGCKCLGSLAWYTSGTDICQQAD